MTPWRFQGAHKRKTANIRIVRRRFPDYLGGAGASAGVGRSRRLAAGAGAELPAVVG